MCLPDNVVIWHDKGLYLIKLITIVMGTFPIDFVVYSAVYGIVHCNTLDILVLDCSHIVISAYISFLLDATPSQHKKVSRVGMQTICWECICKYKCI